MDLDTLFVEFNAITVESLLCAINNRIDWYTEMLYDDPWNTWAQISKSNLEELSKKIELLYVKSRSDNDIDILRV